MNVPFSKALLPALISTTFLVAGCGGGGSDNNTTSSRSVTTSGIVTGFGSMYVNGVKFETDDASFDIDDDSSASQDDMRVGMHCTIQGTINADGKTGTATYVSYDNELEGPVSAIDDTDPANIILTILGLEVTLTPDTTYDDDHGLVDASSIQVGDILEVSGYTTDTGVVATHVEKQDPGKSEFEIKGEIANLDTASGQFTVRGLTIMFDSTTILDDIPGNTLSDGLFVEVKGSYDAVNDVLTATKIEAEDDGHDDDMDDYEVEGIISNYDDTTQTFEVQGHEIDASNSPTLIPSSLTLADGMKVEVEGELVNDILVADKIKIKGRKIKVQAAISSVDMSAETVSFSLFGGTDNVTVRVNQQTELEDESGSSTPLSIDNLVTGDFVELEAFDDGSGVINAVELHVKDSNDSVEYKAPLEGYDETTSSVTMFGVSYDLTSVTSFVIEDHSGETSVDSASFFAELATGKMVKLVDKDPADGTIDEAELDED
jgi:hypothetical protein